MAAAGTISVCSSRARPHIMTYAFLADVRRLHPPRRPQGAGGCRRWGPRPERRRTATSTDGISIDVTRTVLRVANLPDALAGLRIGFMTDLHRSSTVPHELIESATGLLMARAAGSHRSRRRLRHVGRGPPSRRVIVTSSSRRPTRSAALSAPHGVFGVLGNHDDDRSLPAAMADRGVEILKDARTRLTCAERPSISSGFATGRHAVATSPPSPGARRKASILLAHNPSRLKEAAALSLPLMLSGHTHGGQIVLPGLGAVAARNFPIISGVGGRDAHDGVRKPRRRNGLRPYSDQLPARGRAPHPATLRPGVTAGA